jgi:hypothetical protein
MDTWSRSTGRSDCRTSRTRNCARFEEGKNLFAVFDSAALSDAQKQTRIQQIHVITAHKVRGLLTHERRKTMTETASAPASDAIFWLPANLLI